MNKSLLKDSSGRPLTQGLFLETKYDTTYAVYTLKDEDFIYQGKTYLSLKRLYLEFEDPVEYAFANQYLLNWDQWQRICNNKLYSKMINGWREELELKIRSQSLKGICDLAAEAGNFQAYKFLMNKEWDKRAAGRPSTKAKAREDELLDQIANDYSEDIKRATSRIQ
jgi:hypothetical protein